MAGLDTACNIFLSPPDQQQAYLILGQEPDKQLTSFMELEIHAICSNRVSKQPAGAAQGEEFLVYTKWKRGKGKNGTKKATLGQAPYKYAESIASGCGTRTCLQFFL